MKNKFMRSVTAMVVAVTMLISSQGVVTSFADGGDYSDMSEYSSVQMNEVSNNGTDQSTEDDAAQCNCGVTDGEAHKENCPLYVKPDSDNTDGNNIEDDVAQCTCGAEEGGPHKEDCPLYVKPDGGNTNDGDTDNGAGEDTDIKSVVDAINALPAVEDLNEETNYEELKAQVASARAAYDALTVEEKAQVTNYNLLTDIEAYIDEIIKSSSNTISGEGWEWDESTKTLKITNDIDDSSSSPWKQYSSSAKNVVLKDIKTIKDIKNIFNHSLDSLTIDGFDKICAYSFQGMNLS